jgi:PPOX class probable F420-dependent enzyme
MIEASQADMLGKAGFAHVATIGPHGEPQTTPVWYDWDGTYVKISQTTDRQKYRNVGRDPRIALSITDPDDPYRYLEVRGQVESVDADPDYTFINSLAKKYLDQDEYPFHQPGDERVILWIRPEHTTGMG